MSSALLCVHPGPRASTSGSVFISVRRRFLLAAFISSAFCLMTSSATATLPLPQKGFIAVGETHSIAVKYDGTVFVWGTGYPGNGGGSVTSLTPTQVSGLSNYVAVAGGTNFTLGLKTDGTVWSWGANESGQLGNGTPSTVELSPVQAGTLTGVTAVTAGHYHSFARVGTSDAWGWGGNYVHQVSTSSTTYYASPVGFYTGGWGGPVAAGYEHTVLAHASDGSVEAWWRNNYGQSGDDLSGLSSVINVAAGSVHSVALLSNGTVSCWGYNGDGELGDGTHTNTGIPVTVSNLGSVIAIAAGWTHTVALKSDGTVWTWGSNAYGQLGDGTTTNRNTRVQVTALGNQVAAIAADAYVTLALKKDGTIWGMGQNSYGQLGDGTKTNRSTPVQVAGLIVAALPTITVQPQGQAVAAGSNVTFSVTATSPNSITYQWRKNGVNIAGATSASYSMSNVQASNVADYTVVVSAPGALVSNVASLVLLAPDATAPFPPPKLDYADKTAKTVTLLWSAATDNVGVVGYAIFRGGTQIGTTSELSFVDSGLFENTPYTYTVKALDAATNVSAASPTLYVTTTQDFTVDGDHDGLPNAIESALGTNASAAASAATTETGLNVHRPTR